MSRDLTATLARLGLMRPQTVRRMVRRQQRDVKEAHAAGLMTGICTLLRPGDVVIDCGANLGHITERLAARGAHVHAFEPDPFCFAHLTERFAGRANVTLHNAAVGATTGTVQLMRVASFDKNPAAGSLGSTVIAGGRCIDEQATIEVPMIDLPGFLHDLLGRHAEIAFLKMDIEGAELDLLDAMDAQTLFERIRLTVVETHEHKFKALRPRYAALRARMSEPPLADKVNLDWI